MRLKLVRELLWAAFVLFVLIPSLINGMEQADAQMLRQVSTPHPVTVPPAPAKDGLPTPVILYRR